MKTTIVAFVLYSWIEIVRCFDCPQGWWRWDRDCYWIEGSRLASWDKALTICKEKGARLLSLNDRNEARHLAAKLTDTDITRQLWYTSGIFSARNIWEWQGDGTKIHFGFWHINVELESVNNNNGRIAFAYRNGGYRWLNVDPRTPRPFVCEIPVSEVWKVKSSIPNPELYGLSPKIQLERPRRPKITQQPEDVIVFEEENGYEQSQSIMKCNANGNPSPSVKWYKGSSLIMIDLSSPNCLVQADGSLIFVNITRADYGSYYCTASNHLGTVRSKRARISPAFIREFDRSRLDIYGVAGLGKDLSCNAPDHFPRTLSFTWSYDSVKTFLRESSRVFISRDGNLYFSYLEASDQNSYSCSVVSSELQTGHYGPFFKLLISTPEAGVPESFKPRISKDFPKVFPERPMLGRQARLECFAFARPAPHYKWIRLDGEMPAKSEFLSHGRVLYIPSLSDEDKGIYRCIASNLNGNSTKEISLNLNSAPVLLSVMGDRFAMLNSTVTFICDVYASPKVEYEWFRNGLPVSPLLLPLIDQHRFTVDQNKLTIIGAKTSDSGIYQCIATNGLGQTTASAYLSVRTFAPSFQKLSDNPVIYGRRGKTVFIPCTYAASPAATTLWRKDGKIVDLKGRFRKIGDSLKIEHVRDNDYGFYTCEAANLWGSDSIVIGLLIVPSVNILLESSDHEFSVGSQKTFSCSLESRPCLGLKSGFCPESAIKWTFNSNPIHKLPQFSQTKLSVFPDGLSQLTIPNITSLHSGLLMCHIDTIVGHSSKLIAIEVDGRPKAPVSVLLGIEGDTWVKSSWKMPNNRGKFDKYRVEIKSQWNQEWISLQSEIITTERDFREFKVDGLTPYTEYKLRLSAHHKFGWSKPSYSVGPFRTKAAPPTASVEIISARSINPGDIVIKWKSLVLSEWHDAELNYKIEWANGNDSNKSSAVINGTKPVFTIRTHSPVDLLCVPIKVTIFAFNSKGSGPITGPLKVYPFYNAPSKSVTSLNLTVLNETALRFALDWSLDRNSASTQGCEPVIGFEVNCWTSTYNLTTKWIALNRFRPLSIDLTDLETDLEYFCYVTPMGPTGLKGPNSTIVSAFPNVSVPEDYPQKIIIEQISDKYVNLEWTPVYSVFPIEGYKVFLYHGETSENPQELSVQIHQLLNPASPAVKIKGLQFLNFYKIQVAAYTADGLGPKSNWTEFRFGYLDNCAVGASHNWWHLIVFQLFTWYFIVR